MLKSYKGRLISSVEAVTNTTYASSVWGLQEQMQGVGTGLWPTFTPLPALTPADIGPVTALGASAFSYATLPASPRTLLNYMQSFGVNGSSTNDGSSNWNNGFATLNYTASPIQGNDYFTRRGRVIVINGDGGPDLLDWAVFNFDVQNGQGDFDGSNSTLAYFGGESSFSGGTGAVGVGTGRVWGFNTTQGWTLLYQLNLPGDGTFNHTNGNWFNSGGSVGSGNGKRTEYDNLSITHLGFSVI